MPLRYIMMLAHLSLVASWVLLIPAYLDWHGCVDICVFWSYSCEWHSRTKYHGTELLGLRLLEQFLIKWESELKWTHN